jgi:hypothetical protein
MDGAQQVGGCHPIWFGRTGTRGEGRAEHVMSCVGIRTNTLGGGWQPNSPTWTKLRPHTAPDSISRRMGLPKDHYSARICIASSSGAAVYR